MRIHQIRSMMRLLLISFVILSGTIISLVGQTEQNGRPMTAKDGEEWVIRWNRSDDLNGDEINWSKWQQRPENFSAWTWDNVENTAVSDGSLKITLRQEARSLEAKEHADGTSPTRFKSGMLKSYAKGRYGY